MCSSTDIPPTTNTIADASSSAAPPAPTAPPAPPALLPQAASAVASLPSSSSRSTWCQTWTYLTEDVLHEAIRRAVRALSRWAARHPWTTIGTITVLSLALIATGFVTNFELVLNHRDIFTPVGSYPAQHYDWITRESNFPGIRPLLIVVHRRGDSVLQAYALQKAFQALQTVQATPGYHEVCPPRSSHNNGNNRPPAADYCRISSPTQFWNHTPEVLHREWNGLSSSDERDAHIVRRMSRATFPDGTPVFREAILGNHQMIMTTTQNTTTTESTIAEEEDDDDESTSTQPSIQQQPQQLLLTSAQSFIIKIDLPELAQESDALERRILRRLEDLRQSWRHDPTNNTGDNNNVVLEYFTMYAYLLEFERAVYGDIYLVVLMMVLMVGVCCAVFFRRHDRVQSRALVGVFSIATIGMSLMTGYGIVWCIGVPFTNICMMVPFIVVGVGLDDTFIITGAYFRKSRRRRRQAGPAVARRRSAGNGNDDDDDDDPVIARVQETMDEIGLSISLTTITTMTAFGLGTISSIPAIRWLCIYGFTCIGVDFIYQITYFVAWMVLDERRVQANRKDCCVWITVQNEDADEDDEIEDENNNNNNKMDVNEPESDSVPVQHGNDNDNDNTLARKTSNSFNNSASSSAFKNNKTNKNCTERFMGWYADRLLHPVSKVLVLVLFTVYLAGCVYSTSLLTQEFKVESYVPKDSHVNTFFKTFEEYSSLFRAIGVYFRNIDQSDPLVQQQMLNYVEELSQMEQIGEPPQFFWLRDFAEMATAPEYEAKVAELGLDLTNKTFEEQVDLALSIPEARDVYGQDVVRDPDTGKITASRCFLYLRKLDIDSVPDQIDVLMDQREITKNQPLNQDSEDFAMFTFDDLYFYWELYSVSVDELIFTTVSGVIAVSVVTLLLIPHWSAVVFVTPLIIILYFMLLGTMQYSGIHINAVTYVIIVMAIGLLVDFLMHMLLRYYETTGRTRHQKVKETLETMGTSILLGGLTTIIGVMPLAFSTTTIFMVVFKSFLAMVCLGCGIGLILLPVLLSLVGPVNTRQLENARETEQEGSTAIFSSNNSYDDTKESDSDSSSDDQGSQRMSADASARRNNPLHLVMSSSTGGGYEIEV